MAERFRFKRLDAYQEALGFFVWALGVAERFPRWARFLADQFLRAALSVMLNIAEATGLWRKGNKRKSYEIARGSTFEAAALLDALLAAKIITRAEFEEREEQLAGVGSRLTRLCQKYGGGKQGS